MRSSIILLLAALPACFVPVEHDEDSFDVTDAVARLDVSTPTGDLIVRGADVTAIHVEVDYRWTGDKPVVDWDVDGDTLLVEAVCDRPSWFCSVDLELTVPHDLAAEVASTTGDVTVRDLEGEVEATTTTGDVALTAIGGPTMVQVTTGQIVGRALEGETVDVEVTTGDVDLVHEGGFTRIAVASTTGDIRILVPGGTYDCSAENTTGNIEMTGLVDDPSAPAEIVATTTTGNIEIVGYTIAP